MTRMQGGLPHPAAALSGLHVVFTFGSAAFLFGKLRTWLMPSPRAGRIDEQLA